MGGHELVLSLRLSLTLAHYKMSLSQCHVMVVLFFANVMAPGPALGVNCKYFGTELGTVGDFVVKDTCPPPQNNEVYYFTVDIDSGSSGSVVMQATLLSPADTACDGATCNSNALPGYDVYVSDNCLPLPNAPGMSISGTSPNDSNANKKELSFTAKSFTRFYLGLSKKSSIAAGNPSCSFKLFPGAADGAFDCSIADYKESLGIQPCNPPISSIDIRIVLAAAGCGIGASALVFLYCWWRDRKRRTGKMLSDAEEELAETIAAVFLPLFNCRRNHLCSSSPPFNPSFPLGRTASSTFRPPRKLFCSPRSCACSEC